MQGMLIAASAQGMMNAASTQGLIRAAVLALAPAMTSDVAEVIMVVVVKPRAQGAALAVCAVCLMDTQGPSTAAFHAQGALVC
eukprot:scaffold221982_cov18-Tisochrysis_lutea.AAC.1